MRAYAAVALAIAGCSRHDAKREPPTGSATPKAADDDHLFDPDSLGTIHFLAVNDSPAARAFTRGIAALHSFWYEEAIKEFAAAIAADPSMNMAYWGAAMARCPLLWHDDDLPEARAWLARMPAPQQLTPREQAWVSAAKVLIGDGTVMERRKRFAAAMADVNAKFPDDESATFLSIALLASVEPDDPSLPEVRERAAALAIGVFEHNPKHPGAAHYLIHAYDTPELAHLALPYALAYAKIAPAAFHARHMPAHVFSRLGMWKQAVASCQSAWDVSLAAARRDHLTADHDDFHSLNWVIEMDFELGRRGAAATAMQVYGQTVRDGLSYAQRWPYAVEVSSYLTRTGDWSSVDALLAPLDAPALDRSAPGSGISPEAALEQIGAARARALSAAMQRDLPRTQEQLAALDTINSDLRPYFVATQSPAGVASIDQFNTRFDQEMTARARGDDQALLVVLRANAAPSDKPSAIGEHNPNGIIAGEELADALLRTGDAKGAAAAYAQVLEHHVGRAHALLGAARAAAKLGDHSAAKADYQKLLDQWDTADPGIDGLAEAHAAVAAN